MVLYLIGLGLGDEKDITINGLEAIKRSSHVFLEHYTAILGSVPVERLEALYGKKITVADREMVESQSDLIIAHAKESDVSFLVVGDPFAATTHHDLLLRAADEGIEVRTIHNASIMNAVAQCGLQLYNFGQTISVCFFREGWRPDSFYDKVLINTTNGMHTLCLLDIKVKEQTPENLAKGIKEYEAPRYMTINTCIEQLFEVEDARKAGAYNEESRAFGIARIGQADQQIVSGTLRELLAIDFGAPLHSLVIAAPHLHDVELAMYEYWHWDKVARGAARKAARAEREAKEAVEEAARLERLKIEEANAPKIDPSSFIPKTKAPVRASSSVPKPSNGAASDSEDEQVVMEPLC